MAERREMTAKEMFEKLGFVFAETPYLIMFTKRINDWSSHEVWFSKVEHSCINFMSHPNRESHDYGVYTPSIHLAIHQQMKELGWIE